MASTSAGRVRVRTTFDLAEYVFAALKAGAGGFLVKDTRFKSGDYSGSTMCRVAERCLPGGQVRCAF